MPHQQPPIKASRGRVIQSDFREMFRAQSADRARGCPVRERKLPRKKERHKGKENLRTLHFPIYGKKKNKNRRLVTPHVTSICNCVYVKTE